MAEKIEAKADFAPTFGNAKTQEIGALYRKKHEENSAYAFQGLNFMKNKAFLILNAMVYVNHGS